jgi:hypothetical protein
MTDNTKGDRDLVSLIMAWEDGAMSHDEELEFFQSIVKTGLVYQLQGMYGRRAHALGLI